MTYIKRAHQLPLAEVRKDILYDIGIHVDYYPPYSGASSHCAWVCVDKNCDKCGDSFNSFPAFLEHLRVHHGIQFCISPLAVSMRQKYHNIDTRK